MKVQGDVDDDDEGPELWEDDDSLPSDECCASEELCSSTDFKLIQVYLFFFFMFQTLFHLSDVALHMVEIWKKLDFLLDKHFEIIQQSVDGFVAPSNFGRQPTSKISLRFTADK